MRKIYLVLTLIFILSGSLYAAPVLKITEVFFKSTTTTVGDFAEIYCVDDGNNGNGVNVSNYSLMHYTSSWRIRYLGDTDDDSTTPNDTLILRTGDFYIIYLPNFLRTSTTVPSSILLLSTDNNSNNAIDCVVWDDGYTFTAATLTQLAAINTNGLWSASTRNGVILSQPNDRRLPGSASYFTNAVISRYFANGKLADNSDSYLNWIITQNITQNSIPAINAQLPVNPVITGLFDTPNDKGGNITVRYNPSEPSNFSAYNIYISTTPVNLMQTSLKPVIVKTNVNDTESTISVADIETTTNYNLLENNQNYYVFVTVTDKFGRENRNAVFTKYTKPQINLMNDIQLRITEVLPAGYGDLSDMIEIYCVDDGNGGNGSNLAGYSISAYSLLKNILADKTKYKGNLKIFENLIIKTGDFCVTAFGKNLVDDKAAVTNKIKTYSTKTGATADDIIVIFTPTGNGLDCIAYTDNNDITDDSDIIEDYDIAVTKISMLGEIFTAGLWNSSSVSGMVLTGKMNNNSIVRKNKFIDTDSKDDWEISSSPSLNADPTSINSIYTNIEFQNRVFMVDGSDLSRASVNINFVLNTPATINVRVYDVQGRLVKSLKDSENLEIPGNYTVSWDGRFDNNRIAPTGIYIVLIDFFSKTDRQHSKYRQTVVAARNM